jgi:hypothetical protein
MLANTLLFTGKKQILIRKQFMNQYLILGGGVVVVILLMRWGKYTVAVIDPVDGKTLRFHMLESKREQAALELKLREKYGVANVVGGVLDEFHQDAAGVLGVDEVHPAVGGAWNGGGAGSRRS